MTSQSQSRIHGYFDGNSLSSNLGELCRELITQQIVSWPEYAKICDALSNVRTRTIQCEGFSVRLIFNPGRSVNTSASVTPEDILGRPCFLCSPNLPGEQKAILYRNDFLILVNPRPIVPWHLTIAHKVHLPQSIGGNLGAFLHITADLGSDFATLYNGPRCGASAPDHLHFQAVPSSQIRLEEALNRMESLALPSSPFAGNNMRVLRGVNLGREVISIESGDPGLIENFLVFYMQKMEDRSVTPEAELQEPMINIAATYRSKNWKVFLFPRRAHRPSVFYKPDPGRILVSPAVMEMAGIIVTPRERDFESIDARTIVEIYREVSAFPYSTQYRT